MAGIPGLRDIWGAIGDGLDFIGDTAEEALTLIASPFVDEEGELFGFISKDDLVGSYRDYRTGEKTKKPTGSKQYVQQGIEALNTQAVDTMGAGDAAFAYACMFINSAKKKMLVGLLSSIAGAIKTTIVGHEKFLELSEITRTLEGILKE